MAGIALGRWAWDAGVFPCAFPSWWWIALLGIVPFSALLNRRVHDPAAASGLRWPESAGFVPPRPSPTPGVLVAIALCLAAGCARYGSHPLYPCLDAGDLAYWNAPYESGTEDTSIPVLVEGYITSYPSVRDTSQRLDVRVETLLIDDVTRSVDGVARLEADLDRQFGYGQPVRVRGVLTDPYPGDGNVYRDYLARRGIRSQIQRATVTPMAGDLRGSPVLRALYPIRARGEAAINRLLPAPYASIANGMLLGIETGIPRELMDSFQATGTSHVIVISGSNVALIAGVLAGIFARIVGKRRAWVPVVIGIAAYALLVGGDMAVLRAALMGGLAVIALGMGRRGLAIVSLFAACWLLVAINPLALYDAGFQLSAFATAGLIVFTPILAPIAERLWPGGQGGPISSFYAPSTGTSLPEASNGILRGLVTDTVVVSLAAAIAVTPLIAYTFGRVSGIGLLANFLITPVQPLITVAGSAGALTGAAGALLPAQLLLWAAWPGLFWTVEIVERFAVLPFASLETSSYSFGAMAATYAAMGVLLWRRPLGAWLAAQVAIVQDRGRNVAGHPVVLVTAALVTLLIWWAHVLMPDGRLHLYFLDVGQGDGILIQSPSGRQVLVDGGDSPQALLSELGAVMPFWDRSLDMVVLTHADGDHMDAQTQTIGRLGVGQAITQQAVLAADDASAWRRQIEAAGVPVEALHEGGWIDLGDGAALWVLNPSADRYVGPDPDNEGSLVVKVVYGDFSALLTGDAGLASENGWLAAGAPIQANVLKVGHHGSRTSTGAEFVAAVDPQIAVIQVGADNRYGHPHAEVIESLHGRMILRSDEHGRVHIVSDGHQMWLDVAKAAGGLDDAPTDILTD
ncbi:MAG: ComEC/Rec2 family competence protein [Caldilineaceae bacterium]